MLIETGAVELMQQAGQAEQLVRSAFDMALRELPQPQESFFEDREIGAVLDMSRTAARLIILVTVVAAFGYWTYAMYLLMLAGDEARRLERCREVIWNVVKGLVLGVCSYLIVSGAVTLYINSADISRVVRFWDDAAFAEEFDFDELLGGEVALEGEVIMLDGVGRPVVCRDGLEQAARDAGWVWVTGIEGTGLDGCSR